MCSNCFAFSVRKLIGSTRKLLLSQSGLDIICSNCTGRRMFVQIVESDSRELHKISGMYGEIIMTNKENRTLNESSSSMHKIPIDIRIVAYFLYIIGFFQLAFSILLFTKIGHLGDNYTRRIFFGTILLSTELNFSIYMLFMAFTHLLCACGLIRINKFFWFFALVYSIYYLIDGAFLFQQHRLTALIGIGISIAIISWLYFRRKLYMVGSKQCTT